MKRAFAWILVLTVIITLTSCTPPKDGGTANPENGSMVPAPITGTGQPQPATDALQDGSLPPTGTGGAVSAEGKSPLTSNDASAIQDITKLIDGVQQYLNDETLPDINTD